MKIKEITITGMKKGRSVTIKRVPNQLCLEIIYRSEKEKSKGKQKMEFQAQAVSAHAADIQWYIDDNRVATDLAEIYSLLRKLME